MSLDCKLAGSYMVATASVSVNTTEPVPKYYDEYDESAPMGQGSKQKVNQSAQKVYSTMKQYGASGKAAQDMSREGSKKLPDLNSAKYTSGKESAADFANRIWLKLQPVMMAIDSASGTSVDPHHPKSDTLVFDCNRNKECKEVGDLATFPERTKEKIKANNFQYCEIVGKGKTRLSDNQDKEFGAIVTGTTDKHVCQSLDYDVLSNSQSPQKNRFFYTSFNGAICSKNEVVEATEAMMDTTGGIVQEIDEGARLRLSCAKPYITHRCSVEGTNTLCNEIIHPGLFSQIVQTVQVTVDRDKMRQLFVEEIRRTEKPE